MQLVFAFILFRLDYCKSVFADVLQTALEPLQRVQNAALRLFFQLELGGACHPTTAPATLVACALAHSFQTLYDDTLDTYSEVPSLPERYRQDSYQQLFTLHPAVIYDQSLYHSKFRVHLAYLYLVCMEFVAGC